MMTPFQGLVGGTYSSELFMDSEECVNLMPVQIDPGANAKSSLYLKRTPGISLFLQVQTVSSIYDLFTFNGRTFVAAENRLVEIGSDGQSLRTLIPLTDNAPYKIVSNGRQLLLPCGQNGYIFDLSANTMTQITDAGWLGGHQSVSIDGYFLILQQDSNTFFYSGVNNGLTYDPLDYVTITGTENILAMASSHRLLWLFGATHFEVWQDTGNQFTPFQRMEAGYGEQGIYAIDSLVELDNTLFFIGQDHRGALICYRMNGFVPTRISTHSVERAWQEYDDFSDAKAWTYQEDGRAFYVVSSTKADCTWVYDLSANFWHRRGVFAPLHADSKISAYHRQYQSCHTYNWGKHICGDYFTRVQGARIYLQSLDIVDDLYYPIRWMRRAPHISIGQSRLFYNGLRIEMELTNSPDGIPTDPNDSDPVINLRYSDDGGYTWSSEISRELGPLGTYRGFVEWWRLGMGRDRVYEISGTGRSQVVISGAYLDLTQGAN